MIPIAPLFPDAGAAAPAPETASDRAAAGADFDSFLQLLTAQLRNQDPLQPIDSTEFVAQLASFSSVEQLVGVNEKLDRMAEASDAATLPGLPNWIGREVASATGRFTVSGDETTFSVPTVAGTERVEATIALPDGTVLRRFTVATDEAGLGRWDNRGDDGNPASDGLHVLMLSHYQGDTLLVETPGAVYDEVVSISGTADGPVLETGSGMALALAEVGAVRAGNQ